MTLEEIADKFGISYEAMNELVLDLSELIENPDIRVAAVSTLVRDGYSFKPGAMQWEKENNGQPVRSVCPACEQREKDVFADPFESSHRNSFF